MSAINYLEFIEVRDCPDDVIVNNPPLDNTRSNYYYHYDISDDLDIPEYNIVDISCYNTI